MAPPPQSRSTLPAHIRPSLGAGAFNSTRSITTSIGGATTGANSSSGSTNASPVLLARINEKRAELERLKELKNLSGQMAAQMQALEERLATLNGGAEAIALVLSNWHSVLGAIGMASSAVSKPEHEGEGNTDSPEVPLPQTLVRIPVREMDQVKAKGKAMGE